MVTFEVTSSRYPRPGAKLGADSGTRVTVLLTSTLQTAAALGQLVNTLNFMRSVCASRPLKVINMVLNVHRNRKAY